MYPNMGEDNNGQNDHDKLSFPWFSIGILSFPFIFVHSLKRSIKLHLCMRRSVKTWTCLHARCMHKLFSDLLNWAYSVVAVGLSIIFIYLISYISVSSFSF